MKKKTEILKKDLLSLLNKWNKTAEKEQIPIKAAIVFVDQSIPEDELEYYEPEELEEHLVFDTDSDSHNIISMLPTEMEEMFFERGWFPSSFC